MIFNTALTSNDFWLLAQGASWTILITAIAVFSGSLAGAVFGVFRATAPWWTSLWLGQLLDLFRSVPLLIQLVLVNSLVPMFGIRLTPFVVSCLVLSIYASAYCAEIVRAGVLAVPIITRRAARSLGMTWWQDIVYVVYPLALRVVLPSWIGLALGIMKDTTLVGWIGVVELLKSSQILITRMQNEPLFILGIAGLIYFLISFPISLWGSHLERKFREND